MRKIIYLLLALGLFTACTKEIDFDFNEIDPIVVIEGHISNEGCMVVVSRSRSVNDATHAHCLEGAIVTITGNGSTIALTYDVEKDCYYSSVTGVPGNTYQLSVDFEGKHYEATSLMPSQAPIVSSEFMWMPMMNERWLSYEMWAKDPNPDQRNYLWFRMYRFSSHPHFEGKPQTEPYTWDLFDDRGCPPGTIFMDMVTVSEKMMNDDEKENWKWIFYDGDRITAELITVDRTVYNYLCELRASQYGRGANPHSNISGGCLGFFAAESVSHTDTIVFYRDKVPNYDKNSN